MAEYRRRRHQEARRRRAPPRHCPCPPAPADAHLSEGPIVEVVSQLGQRLSAYPFVLGLLVQAIPGGARLHVVAAPPMTRPIRALAETWVSRLLDLYPRLELRLQVFGGLPDDLRGYHCAYWRQL